MDQLAGEDDVRLDPGVAGMALELRDLAGADDRELRPATGAFQRRHGVDEIADALLDPDLSDVHEARRRGIRSPRLDRKIARLDDRRPVEGTILPGGTPIRSRSREALRLRFVTTRIAGCFSSWASSA
jgi:hypothetical protein